MGHGWVTPNPDGSKVRCGGPPMCSTCNEEAMLEGYRSGDQGPAVVVCPNCGHRFTPEQPTRATEAADPKKPYGDVTYADPGLQKDGKKRYPLDTDRHIRAAWTYINQAKNAAKYSAANLKKVKAKIRAAMKRIGAEVSEQEAAAASEADVAAAEALIDGARSFDDVKELVRQALQEREREDSGEFYAYCYIADLTASQVVYSVGGKDELRQCSYQVDGQGEVTLGEPAEVVRTYAPAPAAAEPAPAAEAEHAEPDLLPGSRVLEAKGTDQAGGRIFRMQVLTYGDSLNGRRYTEAVMRDAAPLYEGAKAYDHHRTPDEMQSSTIAGLIGQWRNVTATSEGLEGDLHLFPSAAHAAEALDASLAAQEAGLPPLIGASHDVLAYYKPISDAGRRLMEATAIAKVNSGDLVAHPAAGGKPMRMVAAEDPTVPPGTSPTAPKEGQHMTPKQLREALGLPETATDAEVQAALGRYREALSLDAEVGDEQVASRAKALREAVLVGASGGPAPTSDPAPAPAADPAPQQTQEAHPKASWLTGAMIAAKVSAAGLPANLVEAITDALPEQVREADVDAQIAAVKQALALIEKTHLLPGAGQGQVQVTQEARDKKIASLDAFWKLGEGAMPAKEGVTPFRSFRQAFEELSGARPRSWDEDFARRMLRESFGGGFGSAEYQAQRQLESMDTTTWAQVLGDSITRAMIANYRLPGLDSWRLIVSDTPPINDFRTNRRTRFGGYGTLPDVAQGAPYQPLISPGDEEATYAISKRGGTEDVTLEMLANDDVGSIRQIPGKLGRAAAHTLYRFVWNIIVTNAATSYDAVALFDAAHGNTDAASPLSNSTLSVGRRRMRDQTAFGDTTEVLGPSAVPRLLVVPNELEETALQLTQSPFAIPANTNDPADRPNIHRALQPLVVDYYSDANDWFLVADPAAVPTIEVGFYLGRAEPELFSQSDPNVGSMFDADKFTWKIRHIYGLTVLDHRGMYRAQG